MKIYFLLLCCILIFFSCSSDETPIQKIEMPNYFPDTVGSSWVYQNTDGKKWSQEIIEHNAIDNKKHITLKYIPPLTDIDIDFFKPTSIQITQEQILFDVTDKIEHYIHTVLPTYVENEFSGLDIKVEVPLITYPTFIFTQIPLELHSQWNIFNINVKGNFILQDLVLLKIPFDVNFNVIGEVINVEMINSQAGIFDNTFHIRFQTEITQTIFSNEESYQYSQNIWFVPHVGVVKIEDKQGMSELIEYSLTTTIAN